MKKSIIVLFLSLALAQFATAQTKKVDTTLTDSTALITLNDYNLFYDYIVKKLPTSEGIPIVQFWQNLVAQRIAEWKQKHLKSK